MRFLLGSDKMNNKRTNSSIAAEDVKTKRLLTQIGSYLRITLQKKSNDCDAVFMHC